jgi:cell division protein FtsI/penicillin-binding protein 2
LNDYVSLPNRGPARKTAGSRNLKIPEKGRIRVVLAVLALTVAIVKFAGPCGGKTVNTASGVNGGDSIGNIGKNSGINPPDSAKKSKSAEKVQGLERQERALAQPGAGQPGGKNADAKKNAQNSGMTLSELRRLVREYGVNVNTPRSRITVPADTLVISLSIDTALQKYAASMFRQYKPRYAAVAALDPSTGRVLALASYAGDGEEMDGRELYLRNRFPAASVFKTVVAAAAIERGRMHGKTVLEHFGRNHTLYTSQLQKELKVSREITLEDAYAYSVNPVFARIALFNVNKDIISGYGRRFGFNETIPFEYDVDVSEMFAPDSGFSVAEFASGFNRKTTITPLFGALLAGAVCEGGVIFEPTVVDTVRSAKRDSCLYARSAKVWRRAVKEQTAAELRGMMSKVTQYGTARNTFRLLRDSPRYNAFEFGGKTGSVNQVGLGRVDWFVGFARNPNNRGQRFALGVVTTHGDYWTVHSSYIAAELVKKYISNAAPPAKPKQNS